MEPSKQTLFSVDVEDWFHILALPTTPDVAEWDALPSRVAKGFHRLLDVFDETNTKVTCFVLGWVAERYPALIREAASRGHEIASHGYAHRLTYTLTPAAFREDVQRTREILEQVVGKPVRGYRCPGFSVTEATPWFFETLVQAGYRYDSSVFPARRAHGGLTSTRLEPHWIQTPAGRLFEFPITVAHVLGQPMCFFGGGYLRLFPYAITRRMSDRVLRQGRPVVFYVHPREVDPDHPRLPMSLARQFKSYVGLRTTEPKIRRILRDFRVGTFGEFMDGSSLGDAE